jgi:hypothetical protein
MKKHPSLWLILCILALDVIATAYLTALGFLLLTAAVNPGNVIHLLSIFIHPIRFFRALIEVSVEDQMWYLLFPTFFTIIWLWLYAGSGFLLKAARRFDIGFDWFNRKFDIEKKPLQSIGLVAGSLVALMYWTFAIIHRFI